MIGPNYEKVEEWEPTWTEEDELNIPSEFKPITREENLKYEEDNMKSCYNKERADRAIFTNQLHYHLFEIIKFLSLKTNE